MGQRSSFERSKAGNGVRLGIDTLTAYDNISVFYLWHRRTREHHAEMRPCYQYLPASTHIIYYYKYAIHCRRNTGEQETAWVCRFPIIAKAQVLEMKTSHSVLPFSQR
jgi:hypothetical protein